MLRSVKSLEYLVACNSLFYRRLNTTAFLCKNTRAAVVRRSRDSSEPQTYEQIRKPQTIGVHKSWNSWNTANLKDESQYTAQLTWEDAFIRLFIRGTFPTMVLSERQVNMVRICFLLANRIPSTEVHFLTGYSEEMLACILRCPVMLEIQMIADNNDVIIRKI